MMRYRLLLAGLLTAPAMAQTPPEAWRRGGGAGRHDRLRRRHRIPDGAIKGWALKRAYELNGNSMVGKPIDLSREAPATPVKIERIAATPTVVDKPVDKPGAIPTVLVQQEAPPNTCTLHHRHKVYSNGGKSWHCR